MKQSKNFFVETAYKLNRYGKNYYAKPNKASWHLFMFALKSMFVNWNISKKYGVKNTDVLFRIAGGIGDIVIALNYLKALKNYSESNVNFDLIIQDIHFDEIKVVLQGQTFIRNIFKESFKTKESKYNTVIHLVRVPIVVKTNLDFLKDKATNFSNWLTHILHFNQMYPEFLIAGTVSDKLLEEYTKINGRNRLTEGNIDDLLQIKSDFLINVSDESHVLKKFDLIPDKYITFQTGCGKRTNGNIRNWPVENYNKLIKLLHQKYPEYKLIQLGIANTDCVNGSDTDLRGKTNFNELLVLLKNAKIHIDIEAGCVHFRHFLCAKPSVVLFGPTNKCFLGYSENINISANMCSGCEWVHNNWNTCCVKSGTATSCCLRNIKPQDVFYEIQGVL